MPGLIGKKIGMTTIFSQAGKNIPCTILEVGPCKVTQIKKEILYQLLVPQKEKVFRVL